MRSSPTQAGQGRTSRIALGAVILAAAAACTATPRSASSTPGTSTPGTSANATPRTAGQAAAQDAAQRTFAQLEKNFGARLGVYAVDTGNGVVVAYRPDERFAYASTHKVFTVAALLRRTAVADLNRVVPITKGDLVDGAPITGAHVGGGMSLRDLMDAALRYSDNTADDLLFREIGGPAGLAGFLRDIGDTTSHVDRVEPELNATAPGDIRDTSTPRAFAADLRDVVLGTVLPTDRRALLTDMMRANTTGATVIRAGVPAGWQVADKTGTGFVYATRNDIAVVWPPNRPPIVIAVFTDRPGKDDKADDALIAQATTATAAVFP